MTKEEGRIVSLVRDLDLERHKRIQAERQRRSLTHNGRLCYSKAGPQQLLVVKSELTHRWGPTRQDAMPGNSGSDPEGPPDRRRLIARASAGVRAPA
jgi:hypothetical protein